MGVAGSGFRAVEGGGGCAERVGENGGWGGRENRTRDRGRRGAGRDSAGRGRWQEGGGFRGTPKQRIGID